MVCLETATCNMFLHVARVPGLLHVFLTCRRPVSRVSSRYTGPRVVIQSRVTMDLETWRSFGDSFPPKSSAIRLAIPFPPDENTKSSTPLPLWPLPFWQGRASPLYIFLMRVFGDGKPCGAPPDGVSSSSPPCFRCLVASSSGIALGFLGN